MKCCPLIYTIDKNYATPLLVRKSLMILVHLSSCFFFFLNIIMRNNAIVSYYAFHLMSFVQNVACIVRSYMHLNELYY